MQGIQPRDLILLDVFDLFVSCLDFVEELLHTANLLPQTLQVEQANNFQIQMNY